MVLKVILIAKMPDEPVVYEEHQILQILQKDNPKTFSELILLRQTDPRKYKVQIEIIKNEWRATKNDKVTHSTDAIRFNNLEISEIHGNKMIYVNTWHSVAIVKAATQKLAQDTGKLRFIINKADTVEGKILPSKIDLKEDHVLIRANKTVNKDSGESVYRLFFPDEHHRIKNTSINAGECHEYFYIYDLKTSDNKRFRVFTEKELEHRPYVLEGVTYLVDDYADIGYTKKSKIKMPWFFVHTAHPKIPKFKDHDGLFKLVRPYKLTKARFFDHLFYHEKDGHTYLHPDYFMELICAFLFSGRIEGYPLHLLIISKPGAGKSCLEESIHTKLEDYQPIIEGSGSTLKALIPSFKSTTPTQGALITANRFAVVDEFLRILMRIRQEDREHQLAMLNPLLEHKKRQFGSGNCAMDGSMTARMIAVSNPVWGTSNMWQLCDKIDTSFLSRMFVWYFDDKHVNAVHDRSLRTIPNFTMKNEHLISIVDYLQSFNSEFDRDLIKQKVQMAGDLIEAQEYAEGDFAKVREVYDARYPHHAFCLMDGFIKTRCLCEGEKKFIATEEDYNLFTTVWNIMVVNWGIYKEVEDNVKKGQQKLKEEKVA